MAVVIENLPKDARITMVQIPNGELQKEYFKATYDIWTATGKPGEGLDAMLFVNMLYNGLL